MSDERVEVALHHPEQARAIEEAGHNPRYLTRADLSGVRAVSLSAIQRPANEVLDKALPWIEQSKDTPFFAWIHLYDPHVPYRPPEPFATKYKGHPYNGEIAFVDSQIASREPALIAALSAG